MSSQPILYEDFLAIFDEIERKSSELTELIEGFRKTGITIISEEPLSLSPHEEASLERVNNLVTTLEFTENGEEESIMIPIIHELKWIFTIMDGKPCDICGEYWLPVRYITYFYCPKCNYQYPNQPRNFGTLEESKAWIKKTLRRETIKGRDAIYCPFCIGGTVKQGNTVYQIPVPMKAKIIIEVNQFMGMPQGYLLSTFKCKKCGYTTKLGTPIWFETTKEGIQPHIAGEHARQRYEIYRSYCPRCQETQIEEDYVIKRTNEITEADRFTYNLPFIRRGIPVPPPPPEISGVTQRYNITIYRLTEPFVVSPLNLEFTLRKELKEVLNTFEYYIFDKEVRARMLYRLREIVNSLKDNIIRDRTYLNQAPTMAEVDSEQLQEIVKLGVELAGMLDIVLRAYMVEFVHEHGYTVLKPLREFKVALNELKEFLSTATPTEDGLAPLQAPLSDLNHFITMLENNLPQLRGLARAKKMWIMDKERITQRELELMRQQVRAVKELAGVELKSMPTSTADRILALLAMTGREMSLDEIAKELGVKDKKKVKVALSRLVKQGRISRIGEGVYRIEQ